MWLEVAKYNMKKNWIKYIISFFAVLAIRLIPFRAPNVEPIMTAIMPLGKVYGAVMAFVFGVTSIVLFDSITSGIGSWTFFSAFSYGIIGLFAYWFFKNRTGWKNYALYAFVATIAFDAVTGLIPGPLFYNQPFVVALVGQIPFTLMHLVSNVAFAILLSPIIERWFAREKVPNKKLAFYLTSKTR